MALLADNTTIERVPLLDAEECARAVRRLEHDLRRYWVQRGDAFFTLGAAAYLDACGGDGSLTKYDAIRAEANPVIDAAFGEMLAAVTEAMGSLLGEPCTIVDRLARPGFHIFLPKSLHSSMRDLFHLDLQHRYLPVDGDEVTPTRTFTLPLELPGAGGGIEFCRPDPPSKRGRITVEPYVLGELLVHSGRTLHRRSHTAVTGTCRRISLQGHAVRQHGGTWLLYW